MPRSGDASVVEVGEEIIISPGSGHGTKISRRHSNATGRCCRDDHHRILSILSIVFGLSCIGAIALKYSVKAEERQRHDPESSALFAKKAKKFSIISIVVLFSLVASIPVFLALFSYLATLKD